MHNYCLSGATFTFTLHTPPPRRTPNFKNTYYPCCLTAKQIKSKYLAESAVDFYNICCMCEVKHKEVTLFSCLVRILYGVVIKGIIVTVWFYTGMLSQTILWSLPLSTDYTESALYVAIRHRVGPGS